MKCPVCKEEIDQEIGILNHAFTKHREDCGSIYTKGGNAHVIEMLFDMIVELEKKFEEATKNWIDPTRIRIRQFDKKEL